MTIEEIEDYIQTHLPSYSKRLVSMSYGTLSKHQYMFLKSVLRTFPNRLDNPPVLREKLRSISIQEFLRKTRTPKLKIQGCLPVLALLTLLPVIIILRVLTAAYVKAVADITWKQAMNINERDDFLLLLAAHNKIRGRIE